jgi:hypothetical protein
MTQMKRKSILETARQLKKRIDIRVRMEEHQLTDLKTRQILIIIMSRV